MEDQHYRGLVAEWYDDWLRDRTDDIDYYTHYFSGFEGRVLELACGTGRLLIPIAEGGVEIHGLDSAEDMLVVLKRKATALGLKGIELHQQSMEDFTLPVKYDAILLSGGSFQLLTLSESALKSLQCIRAHLEDGGFFLTDIFVPWDDIRAPACESYQVTRDVVRPDGTRSIVLERFEIDIPMQIKRGTYRYEFYNQKQLVACLVDDLPIRWYWKDEFMRLLQEAGYSQVELLTQSPLHDEGCSFVFRASR
jgi:SAM-dependent methyltransferase